MQAAKRVPAARRKLDAVREAGGEHALEAGPVVRELAGILEALEQAAQGRSANVFTPRAPPAGSPQQSTGATTPAAPQAPAPGPPAGLKPSGSSAAAKPPPRCRA